MTPSSESAAPAPDGGLLGRLRVTLRRSLQSIQVDGLRPSFRYVAALLFGTDCRYLLVQYFEPPVAPVTLPVCLKDITVREMTAGDRADLRVRRHEPRDAHRLVLGIVAIRDERIIGAAWFTSIDPQKEWYRTVEPHLVQPAWYDSKNFVVPGEKAAAWALSKASADVLATLGIGSTVAVVGVENTASILLLRLFGAKIVARWTVRRRCGYRTAVVEPIREDRAAAVTGKRRGSGTHS